MLAAFRSHDWNSCPLFPSINVNITFTDVISVSAIGPQGQIITGIRPKKKKCVCVFKLLENSFRKHSVCKRLYSSETKTFVSLAKIR